jgi:hypothetical protein
MSEYCRDCERLSQDCDALSKDNNTLTARVEGLEAAMKEITRIGPLGIDTYPECYRRIQAIARPFASQSDGEADAS